MIWKNCITKRSQDSDKNLTFIWIGETLERINDSLILNKEFHINVGLCLKFEGQPVISNVVCRLATLDCG